MVAAQSHTNTSTGVHGGVHNSSDCRALLVLLVNDMGVPVTTFSGFNTWMAFQGTPERAAVAGDFAMLAHEVAPVIQALTAHDIEVAAVHNHMVDEEPRIFFLHFWGVGRADKLARGLKSALEAQTRAAAEPGPGRRER